MQKSPLGADSKTQKNPLNHNETPTTSHTEFWSLPSTQKGINDHNKEQPYSLKGCVCLFIYHTIAINFPRSSSHSYKLPEKILAKIVLPKKSRNREFQTPPKKFFAPPPCHLKSGVHPHPPPPPPGDSDSDDNVW